MANVVRNLYSNTAGNTPSSLGNGQIGVNQSDGRLFFRSAAGVVTQFSSIASFATTASFPAVGLANVLYLASDNSRAYQFVGGLYVEVGVSGGGVALGDGSVTTAKIADAAVADAKIASVAATKLTGTLADARLSSNIATFAAVDAYYSNPTGACDIYPRGNVNSGSLAIASGNFVLCLFTPTRSLSVSRIAIPSGATVASGTTLAQFGLYSYDETTATLLARVDSDTSLFNTVNTLFTRSFSTTGGYPASYTLQAGTRYGIGLLVVATTAPLYSGRGVSGSVLGITPRMCVQAVSQSSLPTSIAITANAGNLPFARLS